MNANFLLAFTCTLCAIACGNSVPAGSNNGEVSLPFIVGGQEATRNEFPWLVNLKISSANGFKLCEGSLIEKNLVLTAAHCVKDESVSKMNITAGDHNIFTFDGTEQSSNVTAVKIHENFNLTTYANDIALLRLQKNFTLNQYVSTIVLPPANFNASLSGTGQVAGWGTLSFGSSNISAVLRKVSVGITNDTGLCYRQDIADYKLQFCAGEFGKDSCSGDGGAPFICALAPKAICGIVSYGNGCASANTPSVYTHVASYLKWINDSRVNFTISALPSYFSSDHF